MIKLRDAKCPSCGANIEVNENFKKAMCQYCGNMIMVDEAIEKIQLELSGNIKVEGIRNRSNKIETARKHRKVKEFDDAEKILTEITDEDKFDVEAYCEIIKNDIDRLEMNKFNTKSSRLVASAEWEIVEKIDANFARIKKIEEIDRAREFLGEYYEKVEHYEEELKNLKKDEIRLKKLLSKILDKPVDYEIVKKYINCTATKGSDNSWNFKELTREGIIVDDKCIIPKKLEYNFSSVDEIEDAVNSIINEITEDVLNRRKREIEIRVKCLKKKKDKDENRLFVTYVLTTLYVFFCILLLSLNNSSLEDSFYAVSAISAIIALPIFLIAGYLKTIKKHKILTSLGVFFLFELPGVAPTFLIWRCVYSIKKYRNDIINCEKDIQEFLSELESIEGKINSGII